MLYSKVVRYGRIVQGHSKLSKSVATERPFAILY